MSQNSFSGSIPSELGLLSNTLQYFGLSGNLLTGTIPSQLGLAKYMRGLDLSDLPQLSGDVPSELDRLLNIEFFNISGSSGVTGTMAEPLCFLRAQGLPIGFDCSDRLCGCDCLCPISCEHGSCTTSSACAEAALARNASLGGLGYPFEGDWAVKGCAFFPADNPAFPNQVYWGVGATSCDELQSPPGDGSVRLECAGL